MGRKPTPPNPKADPSARLTLKHASELSGRSIQWISQRKRDGYFGNGPLTLQGFLTGSIRYYEDERQQNTKADVANKASVARTAHIEQQMAIRAGQLIPLDDAEAVLMDFAGSVVAAISSIPAASTRSLEARKPIQKACDDTLDSLAKRAEEASETLGADREGSKTAAA